MIFHTPKKLPSQFLSGFTLIELLVVMAISLSLMSVVLFNYSTFTDKLGLSGAMQELAISVRQSQVYGLTVKEVSTGGGNFDSAYGVHFDSTSGSNTSYVIFADMNNNHKYDLGSGCGSGFTECIEQVFIRGGVCISGFCDDAACPPGGYPGARMLDVTYKRPNPDARVYFSDAAGSIIGGSSNTGVVILTSPKGKTLSATIGLTGKIWVH